MTGRRLVLLRHGRTAWNHSGRAQGHADIALDPVGHAQAGGAAAYLSSLRPVGLWSSDLIRAQETCGYLERLTGLSPKYDARLREFDVGRRQGLTLAELRERFPEEYTGWVSGGRMVPVLGGESDADVAERIVPALEECMSSLGAGELGIAVTHGAAIKVAVIGLLGWPAEAYGSLCALDNCAWATLEERGPHRRVRLVGYNQSVSPGRDSPLGANR